MLNSGSESKLEDPTQMNQMNNLNQSRDSFDDPLRQQKELQVKRQYIEELRLKLNNLVTENRYLKGDINAQSANEGLD